VPEAPRRGDRLAFDIDIERCPQRGGNLRIVAAIEPMITHLHGG
jgi:hypothetical protein